MELRLPQVFVELKFFPAGVIHIGASTGQERWMYEHCGIKEVVWVEANPERLPGPGSNGMREQVICEAIWDRDGEAVLHILAPPHQDGSSLLPYDFAMNGLGHDYRLEKELPLRTMTFSTMVEKYGIDLDRYDFLCMDVQGVELDILRDMGDLVRGFSAVALEVCQVEAYKGQATFETVNEYFSNQGFICRARSQWFNPRGTEADVIYLREDLCG